MSILPRAAVAVVGVALLILAIGSIAGVAGLSIAPAVQKPTLEVSLNVTVSGFTAYATAHLKMLPKGSMELTNLTFQWGDGLASTFNFPSGLSGYGTTTRAFQYAQGGAFDIGVHAYGHDGAQTYHAWSGLALAMVPGPSAGGCLSGCPEASSAFTASVSGFNVSFSDTSSIENASLVSVQWKFGDGTCGAAPEPERCTGASVAHTYATPGTYLVKEVVTAENSSKVIVSAGSETNITVPSTVGCAGTGSCGSSTAGITPLSGLIFGLGIGTIIAAGVWRWEGLAIAAGLGLAGLATGMFMTGAASLGGIL